MRRARVYQKSIVFQHSKKKNSNPPTNLQLKNANVCKTQNARFFQFALFYVIWFFSVRLSVKRSWLSGR